MFNDKERKGLTSFLLPVNILSMILVLYGHALHNNMDNISVAKYISLIETGLTMILTIVSSRVFIEIHEEGINKSDEFGIFLNCINECDTDDIRKVRELYYKKNPKLQVLSKRITIISRINEIAVITGFIFVVILSTTI
jgi:hypothetical protein